MNDRGLKPNAESVGHLKAQLIIEGDDEGVRKLNAKHKMRMARTIQKGKAQLVHNRKMETHRTKMDMKRAKRTEEMASMDRRDTMGKDNEHRSKTRTGHLNKFLKQNDAASAWILFEILIVNRAATVYHFSTMMKACTSSTDQRKLMDRMMKLKIQPDVGTYNPLLQQLLFEDDNTAADHVLNVEMKEAGLEPDRHTHQTLARSGEWRSRGHTQKMKQLVQVGNKSDAWNYFQQLLKDGAASVFQCSYAMAHLCGSSAEQKELIAQLQHSDSLIVLSVCDFTILVNQLLSTTRFELLENPTAKDAVDLHADKLLALARREDKKEAWEHYAFVVHHDMATAMFYSKALAQLCANSKEQRIMLQNMHPKYITMYGINALVNRLLFEGDEEGAKKAVAWMEEKMDMEEKTLATRKEFAWKSVGVGGGPRQVNENILPSEWQSALSPEGVEYFYNTSTQATQWERPE